MLLSNIYKIYALSPSHSECVNNYFLGYSNSPTIGHPIYGFLSFNGERVQEWYF